MIFKIYMETQNMKIQHNMKMKVYTPTFTQYVCLQMYMLTENYMHCTSRSICVTTPTQIHYTNMHACTQTMRLYRDRWSSQPHARVHVHVGPLTQAKRHGHKAYINDNWQQK